MLNLGFRGHDDCFLKTSKLCNIDSILTQAQNQCGFA